MKGLHAFIALSARKLGNHLETMRTFSCTCLEFSTKDSLTVGTRREILKCHDVDILETYKLKNSPIHSFRVICNSYALFYFMYMTPVI